MTCESKTYCQYMDHAIMVSPYGEVRPCCRFDSNLYQQKMLWNGNGSLSEFYSTGVFSEIRSDMHLDKAVKGCWRCYEEERAGIPSMRQKPFPTDFSDTSSPAQPAFVEIGVGRKCNLKCRSCNASFSTKWEADAKILNQVHAPTHLNIDLTKVPFSFLQNVQQLKITGGEPFMEKTFHKWFIQLCDQVDVSKKEIEIFTNGTLFPNQDFLNALEKFEKVTISISVDAFDTQNTYLRNPASWKKINENSSLWVDWDKKNKFAQIGVVTTVSIYNILAIFELLSWVQEKLGKDTTHLIFQTVHDPSWMSVERLPVSIKQTLLSEFRNKMKIFTEQHSVSKLLISRLLRLEKLLLSEHPEPLDPKIFLQRTLDLDQLRNENLSEVFPEIHDLLNNYVRNYENATL